MSRAGAVPHCSCILAMSFFPRLSYLPRDGGELHRKGGILLKARLGEWERELQYLRFRIAEWKQFGSAEHPDYYPFRSFLLEKVRNHLLFELKTFSSILMACDVAATSDDVPSVPGYIDSIFTFRDRISPGEVTRRNHLEDWQRYSRDKDEEEDTPAQMDDMFARIRTEVDAMERRSMAFRRMVDQLVGMVDEMREVLGLGGFADRLAWGPASRHSARSGPRSRLLRSPSDLQPTLNLADSRARLPPPLPVTTTTTTAATGSSPLRPASGPPSASGASPVRHQRQPDSSSLLSRTPSPPPPRPARNLHFFHWVPFHRVFHTRQQQTSNPSVLRTRTPSPGRTPFPPPGTPVWPDS
ncbi:hypothetical protein BC826DRAFT_1183354 [Russula brevipes]|nr:hypothetical protein BC826DRAFT_1183354 [Russula brevipes]